MRTAHLILLHKDPGQAERLIQAMNHADFDFYLHVDQKQDQAQFEGLKRFPNVFFIKKRLGVTWGGFSIVKATFNGIQEIIGSGRDYHYINLLSGLDYPLQPPHELAAFFRSRTTQCYMFFKDIRTDWKEALGRMEKYHLTDLGIKGRTRLERLLNRLLPKRKIPYNMHPYGASMFWMLPSSAAGYVAERVLGDKKLYRYFSMVWGADELVFQTLLLNSSYKAQVINDNYRYIDWSEKKASPKILNQEDFSSIQQQSSRLFARKFESGYSDELLAQIDAQLLNASAKSAQK